MIRNRLAAVVCAIAGAAVCAPPASAASWLGPVELDTPATFDADRNPDPVVAVNARGDMVAAWELDTPTSQPIVRVAFRPAGGQTSMQTLAGSTLVAAQDPSVGIDDAGNAYVAWEAVGTFSAVQYAIRAASGSAWDVKDLAGSAAQPAADPVVAVASGGQARFVWRRKNESPSPRYYLQAARRTAGSALTGFEDVTPANAATRDVQLPAVLATAGDGDTTAAWVYRDGVFDLLFSVRAFADADFGSFRPEQVIAVEDVKGDNGITEPALAVDDLGRAVLTYVRVIDPDDVFGEYELHYVARAVDSADFGTEQEIVTGSLQGGSDVAMDSEGNAVAVWGRTRDVGMVFEASARPQGGAFSTTPQTVSDTSLLTNVFDATVGFDSRGTAIAVWTQCPSSCRIASSRRPSAGEFGGVDNVTPADLYDDPRIATDGKGNAVVVANDRSGQKAPVRAAFDGGAPELRSIVAPGGGRTGQALGFSAAPFDAWSPVTVKWSFGDGGSATGTAPKHTYAAPGAYTVTITATDTAGNTSSATRTVQVTTPPSPSGLDGDGDGFTAGQDCNDSDPAIRPGATEIRGNTTDENCDGVAQPFATITSPVSITWGVAGKRTKLMRLKLRQLPAGAKVQLRCKGPGCPFSRKSGGRVRNGKLNALKAFGDKRIVRAGAVVEIRITAPDRIGKVVRYKIRDGKPPKVTSLCLRPGARTPQRRC